MTDENEQSIPSRGSVANTQANLDGWIPVTERLPEVHSPVLVSITESRYPTVATMSIDGEWLYREGDHVMATHWMPLPAPPRQ